MGRFILKVVIFLSPFILIYSLNVMFYKPNEGDLNRLGYIYDNASPKSKTSKLYTNSKAYHLISDLNLSSENKFDILTIGDSFSEQDSLGYQNYLAKNGFSVLHFDSDLMKKSDPIQKVVELVNGDFFDNVHVKFVVLQSVEREFIKRCQAVDFNKSIYKDSLNKLIEKHQIKSINYKYLFFSKTTLKAPVSNFSYLFSEKPFYSQTYKVAVNSHKLFEGDLQHLLFYEDDINPLNYKSDTLRIAESNNTIKAIATNLEARGIKLILLISPDKYDLYYPYIVNKKKFEKFLFFEYFNRLEKGYLFVDSYNVLGSQLEKRKNVYYYDDTHWSPIAAELIAKSIKSLIRNNK